MTRRPTVALDTALASAWLKRIVPSNRALVDQIVRELGGRGEAEVIGVALEIGSTLVLLDERTARTYARAQGLQVGGTLGAILHAKRRGLIEHVTPLLDELRRTGFWLDEVTYRRARELAAKP